MASVYRRPFDRIRRRIWIGTAAVAGGDATLVAVLTTATAISLDTSITGTANLQSSLTTASEVVAVALFQGGATIPSELTAATCLSSGVNLIGTALLLISLTVATSLAFDTALSGGAILIQY